MLWVWLLLLGVAVGAVGTMIGAGGGFILVPILLVIYPTERPEIITCISLAVVFFNAASGSLAYAKMNRIDYRGAIIFSLATMPGAIIGAMCTSAISRRHFDLILGSLLLALSIFLLVRPVKVREELGGAANTHGDRRRTPRQYLYGALLSLGVGFASSLLGIGGGIIHVPAMVHLLGYPVHIATATSHLTLAVMALAGTIVHMVSGVFTIGYRRTFCLAIGVLIGAQVGALLSNRVRGAWIMRGLAVALGAVAVRVLAQGLW